MYINSKFLCVHYCISVLTTDEPERKMSMVSKYMYFSINITLELRLDAMLFSFPAPDEDSMVKRGSDDGIQKRYNVEGNFRQ